jgi:long-chain acyl-CoA synthetase
MTEHLFLTGGTGFIGGRLCRTWLERTSARVTLLVRRRRAVSGQDRIDRLLSTFPADQRNALEARISLAEGDLALPDLGLTETRVAALTQSVTHIVHAGAELRFNLPLERARRTNTMGTAAVLEFARQCPRLVSFQYVSTAYVAGRQKGVIREKGGNGAVQHNNTYERSKFEAEALVRDAMVDIPASVLRPSIVTCELGNGYAPRTSAFFRLVQGIATGTLEALPGRPETQLDLVPVDYVVEAGFDMGRRPGLAGRFFHLSAGPANRISLGEVSRLIGERCGRNPVAILSPREFAVWTRGARRAAPQLRTFLDEIETYAPYLYDHPCFDDGNTQSALAHAALPTRWFPDYCDQVVSYIRDDYLPDRQE